MLIESEVGEDGLQRILFIMLYIVQWNAGSLIANGEQFKKSIQELDVVPVACVQETWIHTHLLWSQGSVL